MSNVRYREKKTGNKHQENFQPFTVNYGDVIWRNPEWIRIGLFFCNSTNSIHFSGILLDGEFMFHLKQLDSNLLRMTAIITRKSKSGARWHYGPGILSWTIVSWSDFIVFILVPWVLGERCENKWCLTPTSDSWSFIASARQYFCFLMSGMCLWYGLFRVLSWRPRACL